MNNQPAVSIIMAAYNAEKYIAEAIESTVSQNYPNFNLIVVDDGSKDNTNKIVQDIAKEHSNVKLITLPRNRGQFYARAHALRVASEFVMFQDADDNLMPDIITKAVEKQLETDADIVYFRTNVLDVASGYIIPGVDVGKMFPNKVSGKEMFAVFASNPCFYPLWGKLYKRELLEFAFKKLNILAGNRITFAEDYLMFSAMFNYDLTLVGLDAVGYLYKVFAASICNRKSDEQDFAKFYQYYLMRNFVTKNMNKIYKKYGVGLDLFVAAEKRFQVKIPVFNDLRLQLILLQIYTSKVFCSKEEQVAGIKQAWEETFFSRCKQSNNTFNEIGGKQSFKTNETFYSNIVQRWNGKSIDELANSDLTFQQVMDVVEQIWQAREKGENVVAETEQKYGTWFANYQKQINCADITIE